jgi:hypothetical protein
MIVGRVDDQLSGLPQRWRGLPCSGTRLTDEPANGQVFYDPLGRRHREWRMHLRYLTNGDGVVIVREAVYDDPDDLGTLMVVATLLHDSLVSQRRGHPSQRREAVEAHIS